MLEGYDWSYQLGGHSLWRPLPGATYSWARAPYQWREAFRIELRWGLIAPSLPTSALAELERSLWNDASAHPLGFAQPAPESLALYLALDAVLARPRREERLRHLRALLAVVSPVAVERMAARCGVRRAWTWAVDAARRPAGGGDGARRPPPPPIDGPAHALAWRAASFLGKRAYPRRLRPRLTGAVGFAGTPARCRFGGVEILVGPGVFAPELPSERLVGLALALLSGRRDPVVVEPGTGSGAISLAIAAGHPGAIVHAVEKYRASFRWARRNARRLSTRVTVHHGSLLEPLPGSLAGRVAVIVANLPYVPRTVWAGTGRFVQESIRGQSEDGLGLYRSLAEGARRFLEPGGHLVLEMGPYQLDAFRAEAARLGYSIESVEPEILGAVVVTARLGDPRVTAGAPAAESAAGPGA